MALRPSAWNILRRRPGIDPIHDNDDIPVDACNDIVGYPTTTLQATDGTIAAVKGGRRRRHNVVGGNNAAGQEKVRAERLRGRLIVSTTVDTIARRRGDSNISGRG